MNTTTPGRVAALITTLLAATLAAVALAAPAQAAAYRYWSYWQGDSGSWVAAQTGPGDYSVVDEDVQGWRFAITTEAPAQTPDNDPDFTALCPDLAAAGAPDGQVRVAVVVDAGFTADAPQGQTPPADVVSCVTVPEGSTGNQALAAAVSVTEDGGLVCGINGYPTDECGAEVSDADAQAAAAAAESEEPNPATIAAEGSEATADSSTDTSWLGFLVGAVILVGLLVAVVLVARRRSDSQQ